MMQMMMMPTIVDEGMREKLRAAKIKQRMLEMLMKQGMDRKSAMEKVEQMAKNLDDGDFDVEEAMGSPREKLRAAMIKQRMLEMLMKQGMDPKTAMEKVEQMAKNLDDGNFDVEEAMGSP